MIKHSLDFNNISQISWILSPNSSDLRLVVDQEIQT